jgi:multisubunit Na+/H+ antiporter MnhE subunit
LKRFESNIKVDNLLISQANAINTRIVNFRTTLPRKTASYMLMTYIPTDTLVKIYELIPGRIEPSQVDTGV